MAAPVLVAAAVSFGANAASRTTASLTLQGGDVVTITGTGEGGAVGASFSAPTTTFPNSGITQLQLHAANNDAQAGAWTFTVSGTGSVTGTVTLTQTVTTTNYFELGVVAHRGAVQATVARSTLSASAARTVSYTASQADSAIVWAVGDWGAATVQTLVPTPTTHSTSSPGPTAIPESLRISGRYTRYFAELDDQPSTGAVSYGIGGTGSGPYSIVVVEVQGASSGGTTYAASGTTAASSSSQGAVSRLTQTLAVAGTIAALSVTSGDVARVPQVQPVSGTVAAASSTSGDVTRPALTLSVTGTIPAVTGSSGDATRVGTTPNVTGTVAAVGGAQGSVASILQASGTVPASSGAQGDATRVPLTLAVSGTVPTVSGAQLGVSVLGGPQTYPASGTTSGTTSVSGAVSVRYSVAATTVVTSASSGTADVLRASVVWQVTGTTPATTDTNATVTLLAVAAGTTGATSDATGAVTTLSPDDGAPVPDPTLTIDVEPSTLTLERSGPTLTLTQPAPTLTLTMPQSRLELDVSDYTVGDTAPALSGTVNADLTGATVELHIRKPDGTIVTKAATVTAAATGAWSYDWAAGEIDQAGRWVTEAQVTYSSGGLQTFAESTKGAPVGFNVRDELA